MTFVLLVYNNKVKGNSDEDKYKKDASIINRIGINACGTGDSKDVFTFANQGTLNGLDPHNITDSFQVFTLKNIYEPLITRDKDLKLKPALAKKWHAESSTKWVFELQKGVTFHNGNAFTADDVLFDLVACRDDKKIQGRYNLGNYCNKTIDSLVFKAKNEMNLEIRTAYLEKAFSILKKEYGYIPLHTQSIFWATKKDISVVQKSNDDLDWKAITLLS